MAYPAPTLRRRDPRPSAPPSPAVRRAHPLEEPRWDAKLVVFPDATFFHGAAWARVLHETYGYAPSYFVHETKASFTGLLPFMEVDSWLTGRRGISLPFTDNCAPLARTTAAADELVAAVRGFARTRRWEYWEVRGGTEMLRAPVAVAFHGHEIALHRGRETNFARCDSSVRRAIRKAERSQLSVTLSREMDAMRAFHALLCKTRRRHGLPPQPWNFFANIQRHVLAPGHGCVVLAAVKGQPIAGAVFFHFGRRAIFKFGASDEIYQHLRPNNLVMWRALEWHAGSGFEVLDLGRTSLANEGLRQFKLSWGAAERRIEYARFDCAADAFVAAKDRSSGWHSSVFKLVPSSLARLIGAVAYKHVA